MLVENFFIFIVIRCENQAELSEHCLWVLIVFQEPRDEVVCSILPQISPIISLVVHRK